MSNTKCTSIVPAVKKSVSLVPAAKSRSSLIPAAKKCVSLVPVAVAGLTLFEFWMDTLKTIALFSGCIFLLLILVGIERLYKK